MITTNEYASITGEAVPADFSACEALACEVIHSATLHAYEGRDLSALPSLIAGKLRLAVALQVLAISQSGGLAGAVEASPNSASLGDFSMSGGQTATMLAEASSATPCPAAQAVLPLLAAYGRGLV